MKHLKLLAVALTLCMLVLGVTAPLQGPTAHAASTIAASKTSNCAQLPATVNSVTASALSNSDLLKYGLPPRGQLPQSKWDTMVATARHHSCGGAFIPGTHKFTPQWLGHHNDSSNWEGNYSNGSSGPYSEADAVFLVPTLASNSPAGLAGMWVGLGGSSSTKNLVQAGISLDPTSAYTGYKYHAWIENLGDWYGDSNNPCNSGPDPCYMPDTVNPGDEIQVTITGNTMTILNPHHWGHTFTFGPQPDTSTADWIMEHVYGAGQLPNFQTTTFYGMGATGSGGYNGPLWQTHDFDTLIGGSGNPLINIGGLVYNTTFGPPNDSNSMTWVAGN